jgi:cytochrome c oxidase cbb3-type subunit 3
VKRTAVKRTERAAVALLLAATVAACDGLPGRPRPEGRQLPPIDVLGFEPLYAANCAGCHGADGRLGPARALNDPVYLALVPPDRLRKIIAEGVPGTLMPAHLQAAGGQLTSAQVDAIAKGMLSRWAKPDVVKGLALPPYDLAPSQGETGDGARGGVVFAAACARCHGPEGKGAPPGGPVVDPTYLALVSDQHLRTTVIAGRPDLDKPDWRGDVPGQPLTPQQISDVVAWLAGHRRPVPGRPTLDVGPGGPRS